MCTDRVALRGPAAAFFKDPTLLPAFFPVSVSYEDKSITRRVASVKKKVSSRAAYRVEQMCPSIISFSFGGSLFTRHFTYDAIKANIVVKYYLYCDVVFDDLYLEQEIEKIKKKKRKFLDILYKLRYVILKFYFCETKR